MDPTISREVLICNEDESYCDLELGLLSTAGYRARVVMESVLREEVARLQAAVVILGMADSSLRMARTLRHDPASRNVSLAVTAQWGSATYQDIFRAGANRVLWKPFTADRFLGDVEELANIPPRHDADWPIFIRREDGDVTTGRSINLSEAGILMQSDDPLFPGEQLRLYLLVPGHVAALAADVVRSASEHGPGHYALQFVGQREHVRRSIGVLI